MRIWTAAEKGSHGTWVYWKWISGVWPGYDELYDEISDDFWKRCWLGSTWTDGRRTSPSAAMMVGVEKCQRRR